MHVLVRRHPGAAVLEDHHFVVAVMRIARAGMDHAVGRDAAQDDALDAVGAQDRFERGAIERADAVLDDVEVARLRGERGMDFGALVPSWKMPLVRAPEKIGEAGGHSR